MSKVANKIAERAGMPMFVCDYSPPRGADRSTIQQVKTVGADFICVAYSPGKSVRVDPMAIAHVISEAGDQDVIFNLACRDMNKLAIQNHLLGAQLLGLDNVLVLQGDDFTKRQLGTVKNVSDYSPTGLLQAITNLNQGSDFRGLKLRVPTSFCLGGVIDLGRTNLEQEVMLTKRKITAGADFFITQAFFQVEKATQFLDLYRTLSAQEFPKPIFWGLQVLEKDSLSFGDVPEHIRHDLECGRPATEIALEQLRIYMNHHLTNVYLIPPILPGGRRNYETARQILDAFRSW